MVARSNAQKLLLRSDTTLWTTDPERLVVIGPLPDGLRLVDRPSEATAAIVFAPDRATLHAALAAHADSIPRAAAFWVIYPKGGRSDLNRDTLWPMVAEHGMRPVTQIAVDEVWSALRFRPLKAGETPFAGGGANRG